jgi:flagellar motor switch protein FliN/FliY
MQRTPPTSDSDTFQPYAFQPLESADASAAKAGLPISVADDVELEVSLELGRAELTMEELLALREGSVVSLDKDADEPIDILANGRLIARGEVIVIDDKFCVRICEVVNSSHRED